MGHIFIQNDFTHGELDPRLYGRIDLAWYYKTARKLRNCWILPQGPATKRPGSLFIEEILALEDEYKLAEFKVEPGLFYLLVFIDDKIRIYRKTADQQIDFLVEIVGTLYSGEEVKELRFSQNNESMIITHPSQEPKELKNGGDDFTWILQVFTFSKIPNIDFRDKNYEAIEFSLSVAGTGVGVLTANLPVFTAQNVGGTFVSLGDVSTSIAPPGVAEITGFTSETEVAVNITFKFDSQLVTPNTILGSKVVITEPAFSPTRGYPKSVTFYEDRLWLGGGPTIPQALFGSKIGQINNFDSGRGFEDDAIIVSINSKEAGTILHLEGYKSLQIFTTRGEFTIPQLEEQALTPGNISVRLQSVNGTNNTEPVVADNQTFFVQRGGRNIMKFVYANTSASYESVHGNNLSSHLINNPVDSDALLSPSNFDAEFVFFVNQDGTLLTLQTMQEQNIEAWTLSVTGQDITVEDLDEETVTPEAGKYKRIQTVGDDVFIIVQRVIDGIPKQYLEVFDFTLYTDSTSVQDLGAPSTVVTGLGHLEGVTVSVKGDGFVLLPQVVEGGEITLSSEAQFVEIGILYNPLIVPAAVNLDGQNGPSMYRRIDIIDAWVDFYKSGPFYLAKTKNTNEIVFDRTLETLFSDTPSTPKTGVVEKRVVNNEAWKVRPEFFISQFDPLPLTILAIGMSAKISRGSS